MQKENNSAVPTKYEDISSSSGKRPKKTAEQISKSVEQYGNGIFKHLGNIIKAISFLVAFGIFGLCLFVGFYLYSKDKSFATISLAIIIAGIVIALMVMFLIFGLGHVICQNNEILRRLKKQERYYY